MNKKIITLILGAIGIVSVVTARCTDHMDENVMAGALVGIVLPCLVLFFYFKFEEENKHELAAKGLAKAEALDYQEIAKKEVGSGKMVVTKNAPQKVERAGVFA